MAHVVGPHFTGEPDDSGAFIGAIDCSSAADAAYVRGLPGVTVFPKPDRHTEPLTDAHVALLAERYGVKKGDTMRDALGRIHAMHPTFWFDSENF